MNSYVDSAPMVDKVLILDTTLRDGEQSAYCTMFDDEKIEIAKKLEELGVDIIEAGFAVSSEGNKKIMKEISEVISRAWLCGLARAKREDIDATYDAFQDYENRMIHIFFPTSRIHIESKMKKSEEEVLKIARESVKYASQLFPVVQFTAEDTTRTNFEFLKKVYSTVIGAGARVINIADTVGCAYPEEFGELVSKIRKFVKGINPDVRISVHCHNDLGLALANTLAAIENGAEQVEVTINGIGERAGNCALEQVVANSIFNDKFSVNVDSKKIAEVSELVSKAIGVQNLLAPVVGDSAFAHKSGVHQHAVVNNKKSYEVLNAEDYGKKSKIVVGPHSGWHGVVEKGRELGYNITKEQAVKIVEVVSEQVRQKKKKRFSDADVEKLIEALAL